MQKTVFCRRNKQELPAMLKAPFPGEMGQELLGTVSQKAWEEWIAHQTILINEYRLSLVDPSARKFLVEEMEKFFSGNESKPEEFVPEKADAER